MLEIVTKLEQNCSYRKSILPKNTHFRKTLILSRLQSNLAQNQQTHGLRLCFSSHNFVDSCAIFFATSKIQLNNFIWVLSEIFLNMPSKSTLFQGFTLVELMIVVTIAGVLAGVAIPSFVSAVRSSRLTSAANQLVTSLNFARSEAVKRGQIVVVRKTSSEWESGWAVFVDIDRSTNANTNAFNDDGDTSLCEATEDCRLRVYEALPTNFTLRGNNFSTYINYKATGESNTNGSFAICDNSDGNDTPESRTSRLIIVNNVGRISQGRDTDGNGIPEKSDGANLSSCTSP